MALLSSKDCFKVFVLNSFPERRKRSSNSLWNANMHFPRGIAPLLHSLLSLQSSGCSFMVWAGGQREPEHERLLVYFSLKYSVYSCVWSRVYKLRGVMVVECEGRQMLSVQVGFAQTCVVPLGLGESCLSTLIYSPFPKTRASGQGVPSLFCLFLMCIRGKAS